MPSPRSVPPVLVAVLVLAGCGTPPELRALPTAPPSPTAGASAPSGLAPSGLAPSGLAPSGLAPSFPALPGGTAPVLPGLPPAPAPPVPAGPCPGRPTAAQVLAVARRAPGLPQDASFRVVQGPLCAGNWQLTTITADDESDPLSVVTRGRPGALRLVEIGTEVCSPTVRDDAPGGIRVLACGP